MAHSLFSFFSCDCKSAIAGSEVPLANLYPESERLN